jgi:hypothetical protein
MRMTPPTEDEQRRFLIGFLFRGNMKPGPAECVARAYVDFARTATGITDGPKGPVLKRSAHALVEALLGEALWRTPAWDMTSFDKWHKSACKQICGHYAKGSYRDLRSGQAQKWLNMSIKYALTLSSIGMLSIPDSESLRAVAHIPLDEFMLTALLPYGAPSPFGKWSQITDYNAYFEYQRWIRRRFPRCRPLDVEFHLWNAEAASRRPKGI